MSLIPNNLNGKKIPSINNLNKLICIIKPQKRGIKLAEIKIKLLLKKYGKYSIVKKVLQFKTFVETSTIYQTRANSALIINDKIIYIIDLLIYLEHSIDIFTHLNSFYYILINKIKEFYAQDCRFGIYLQSFNINCDAVTKLGQLCKRKCHLNFYQCKQHLHIKLKNEIQVYMKLRNIIHTPLIGIINKYAYGVSYSC